MESEDNVPQQLNSSISSIDKSLSSLRDLMDQRIQYDEAKEKAFNYLYTELDDYKKNKTFEEIRPIMVDLILLYDRINHFIDKEKRHNESVPSISGILQTVADEILEILYRREVELINQPDEIFNPQFQRAISTEKTSEKTEDNTIERVVRKGFQYRSRILRPEEVVVKKYVLHALIDEH